MSMLILGLVLFLGIHSVSIFAPGLRNAWATRLGEPAWKGVYSVISAVGLGLIVWGYALARQEPVVLYSPPPAMRHLAALLMLPVFVLLLAVYLPGRIQRAARHPMLVATKLWALAHLLANGTLADVCLFGGFLVWAVADRVSVARREREGGLRPVPALPPLAINDGVALLAGLGLYAFIALVAHGWLFGVRPFG